MTKRDKGWDHSMSLSGRSHNWIESRSDGKWFAGPVFTPYGIVAVYGEPEGTGPGHAALQFVVGGRLYTRHIPHFVTKRGLSILANRFAKSLVRRPSGKQGGGQ